MASKRKHRDSSRGKSAKAAVRRKTTLMETEQRRRPEVRLAPPKQAERRHARPGAGIKRARAVMAPKSR